MLSRYPKLLENEGMLKYFIVLNNALTHPEVVEKLGSEFDYPRLAQFYQTHSSAILETLRASRELHAFNMRLGPYELGAYDDQRGGFPILNRGRPGLTPDRIPLKPWGHDVAFFGGRGDGPFDCTRPVRYPSAFSKGALEVQFEPVAIPVVFVPEAAARAYVARKVEAGERRSIYLEVDFEVLDRDPFVARDPRTGKDQAAFKARLLGIVASDAQGSSVLPAAVRNSEPFPPLAVVFPDPGRSGTAPGDGVPGSSQRKQP